MAKRTMVLGVTVLVTVGLLYSQLCSIRCTVYECSPPAPLRIAQQGEPSEPSSHCQHSPGAEQSAPAPQEHGGSDACLTHVEQTALLPPSANQVFALYDQIQAADVGPLFMARAWADLLTSEGARALPDRSPPGTTFSVLRI